MYWHSQYGTFAFLACLRSNSAPTKAMTFRGLLMQTPPKLLGVPLLLLFTLSPALAGPVNIALSVFCHGTSQVVFVAHFCFLFPPKLTGRLKTCILPQFSRKVLWAFWKA